MNSKTLLKSHSGNIALTAESVLRLRKLLHSNPRNLLFLEIAIDTGLPGTQLLQLKVRDLLESRPGQLLDPHKPRQGLSLGPQAQKAFERYVADVQPQNDDYLFPSRKGKGPLTVSSASRMVNRWFQELGIDQASGLLDLRKAKEIEGIEVGDPIHQRVVSESQDYLPHRIQSMTTQEQVYRELENAILTGRIKPGQKLVAEELSRHMGISRIPVREAIGRLAARGLIRKTPQKGAVVSELSESNILEIQELRLMLELPAAKKAAEGVSEEVLDHLTSANRNYIDAWEHFDPGSLLLANKHLHYTIYEHANMPILMSLIDHVSNLLSPYYHIIFRQTRLKDPRTGPMHHQKIIEGLGAKDVDQVEYWLRKDLEDSSRFVVNVMKTFISDPITI